MTYEMKSLGDVFAEIQSQRGYASVAMSDAERNRNAALINQAGKTAWRLRVWPDFTEISRRTYRPPWDSTLQYTTGQEVWRLDADGLDGHYYRALADNLNVDPQGAGNPATWLVDPPDMALYIEYAQPWESVPIDGVELDKFASFDNPLFVRSPAYVQGLWLVQRSVVFPARSTGLDQGHVSSCGNARGMPAQPWIRFRPPWPKISAVLWDVAESVPTGTLRYYIPAGETSGDCYIALRPSTGAQPDTSGSDWAVRGIPEFFARYIELWTVSQRQSEDEGKYKTLQMANDELGALEDEAITHTGMQPSCQFVGR